MKRILHPKRAGRPLIVSLPALTRMSGAAAVAQATCRYTMVSRVAFSDNKLLNMFAQAITSQEGFAITRQEYGAIHRDSKILKKQYLHGALDAAQIGVEAESRIRVMSAAVAARVRSGPQNPRQELNALKRIASQESTAATLARNARMTGFAVKAIPVICAIPELIEDWQDLQKELRE